MSVLGTLATSPDALPLLSQICFSLSLISLKPPESTRIPPPLNCCQSVKIPLSNVHCYYTSSAVHPFPICPTEISECRHHARCFGKMHRRSPLLLKELGSVQPAPGPTLWAPVLAGSQGLQATSSCVRWEFRLELEVLQTQPLPFSLLWT